MNEAPTQTQAYRPRLKALYGQVITPELQKRFDVKNPWAVPRLSKIVVNMGVGQGKEDMKYFDQVKEDLSSLTGQMAETRRAKKSIAGFKLRQGQPIGLKVTLRGDRMWEFLDRLASMALPRIRDFRGLDTRGFDSHGHYNLGLREHHIFPEVSLDKTPKGHGLNVTFVITKADKARAQATLELLGLPFRKVATGRAPGRQRKS